MFGKIILDNQNLIRNIDIIPRQYEFFDELMKLNKIVSFVGPRRVGKTFLMFQFIKKLINEEKIKEEQVVFLDFSPFSGKTIDPHQLLNDFYQIYPDLQPFFVFDELQDIENFREFILTLYNQRFKIFLSGSNSKLLSSELSTHFRGRVFEYILSPLNTFEILEFNNIKQKKLYSSKELGLISKIMLDVFKYGSFPEIVLSQNNYFKIENLKTYYDILLYKDIIERYKIENEHSIKYLMKSLSLGNSKHININKLYKQLKSQNIKIGLSTLYDYYEYCKNVFFVKELTNYYNEKSQKKVYLNNLGFQSILNSKENLGQNFENFILLELSKKYNNIYLKKGEKEIDFYVEDTDSDIQVCFEINNNNLQREINPFTKRNSNKYLIYFRNSTNEKNVNDIKMIHYFDFCKDLYN